MFFTNRMGSARQRSLEVTEECDDLSWMWGSVFSGSSMVTRVARPG